MSLSRRNIFLNHLAQTSGFPLGLEVERAEGVFIYGSDGKKYYDLNSGISVSSLGHRHPAVVRAVKNQLDRYMHTMVYGEHIQSPQTDYAQLLFEHLDNTLDCIYFLNSGTEVVEAAMKLARKATGRYEIIACRNAYHGSTQGSESLRSDHEYSRAFMPLIPGIRHIAFNNQDDLTKINCRTAAVILEPVQAEAGVVVPESGYLEAVRQRCDEMKCLMVLDEIQTGFGRTGQLFAHMKYNVLPDLMCIGKAMGGGLPIGGLVGNKGLINLFARKPDLGHISTFAGNPVICAGAKATLRTLLDSGLIDEVTEKEQYIRSRLSTHGIVKEIRSSGLMMAVELERRKYLKHVVSHAFERGALIDYFLFNDRSFRLAPPLIYTMDQLEAAMNILDEALDHAQDRYKKEDK